MSTICNVCGDSLQTAIYESPDNLSITTMNKLIRGKTQVFLCGRCNHLQTSELPNLVDYYAQEYEINLASDDDDQLYRIVDGKPVYRAEHQAAVLMSKVDFPAGCRVLDYGCAKAPTLRKTLAVHSDIEPFLFDVTDKYVPFWKRFPKLPQWSIQHTDPAWHGTMDIVLSFYALEHVSNLTTTIAQIRSLLKVGGVFYFLVPNVYENVADFIVADHINHFSKNSLMVLLERAGFSGIEVDDQAHDAAFVVRARLADTRSGQAVVPDSAKNAESVREMARYWREIVGRVRQFEGSVGVDAVCAIYGAGFYGNFIASSLAQSDQIRCFVDQNIHIQGSALNSKSVVSPEALPDEVTHIFVGMNPRNARANIESIASWRNRKLTYFFL